MGAYVGLHRYLLPQINYAVVLLWRPHRMLIIAHGDELLSIHLCV